jgi:thioredoxin reductase
MRIGIIGGGPAGFYAAIFTAKANPKEIGRGLDIKLPYFTNSIFFVIVVSPDLMR